MKFSELNLDKNLERGISDAGYVECMPVQERVLEAGLSGADLYVQSQTGSGKTASYLVTVLQRMLEGNGARALIMAPTRELAVQIEEEAKVLSRHTPLKPACFYGGVGYEKQIAALKDGANILIGTPGRVIDLQKSGALNLGSAAFLVIDEADRMFDMGFYPDLRNLIKFLPPSSKRQTMLFSATLNTWVKNLAWEYTESPVEITIEAEQVTVAEIEQQLFHVASDEKMRLLCGIMKKEAPESLIIFCNTKRMTEVAAKRLRINGFNADFIIGDLPQSKRLKIISAFKSGKLKCLVATDVAARGLDVEDLEMVINFDLPEEAENYVHRIGRTARAGKKGKAYSFCSEHDVYNLPAIERYIGEKIPVAVLSDDLFAEDKSAHIYIKTARYDTDDGESQGKKRKRQAKASQRKRGEGAMASREAFAKNGEKKRKKPVSAKQEKRSATKRQRQKDGQNLSGLSFDERMRYYRKKYGQAEGAKAAPAKKESSAKKTQAPQSPAPSAKKEKPREKGLRGLIARLFGKGKQ